MTDIQIIQPDGWSAPKGYSNGVSVRGRQISIAGQVGWNAQGRFETDDFVGQVEQALKNVVEVLRAGGGKPEHLVRLNWYITDKGGYVENQRAIGEAYRRVIGKHFPAMTLLVVAGLLEDRAKVEIEASAVIPE